MVCVVYINIVSGYMSRSVAFEGRQIILVIHNVLCSRFRFTVVHKTEVIKNTLNPTWKPFTVQVRSLCNGDYDRLLKVECFDWDKDGG